MDCEAQSSSRPSVTWTPSDVRDLLRRALTACVVPLSDMERYRRAVEDATDSELEQIGRRWWKHATRATGPGR